MKLDAHDIKVLKMIVKRNKSSYQIPLEHLKQKFRFDLLRQSLSRLVIDGYLVKGGSKKYRSYSPTGKQLNEAENAKAEANDKKHAKAVDAEVTQEFLEKRVATAIKAGYTKQKWIEFCEQMLRRGYHITLYEAQRTVSKYVTVYGPYDLKFVVRFSNHKPIKGRELGGDCDFFVGHTHTGIRTTYDAIKALLQHFKVGDAA